MPFPGHEPTVTFFPLQPLGHPAHGELISQCLRHPGDLHAAFFACVALGVPDPLKTAEILAGVELLAKVAEHADKVKAMQLEERVLLQKLEALRQCDPSKREVAAAIFRGVQTVKGDEARITLLSEKLRNLMEGTPPHVWPKEGGEG
jgi:hypothetical protein